jgi:hypothetical protein
MIKYLVIHCSDNPDDRDVDAAEIHRWHKERTPPFDGIGYHHVIKRDGTIEAGRPHYWSGAHVAGFNHNSIGVCLVGRDRFEDQQVESLKQLLYFLKFKYQGAEIVGHYQLDDKKTCPNMDVPAWLNEHMPGVQS